MTEKLSAAELVRIAIVWAEESMLQMIDGLGNSDPYRAEVADQLKQMRAYSRRRFGSRPDPTAGARLVGLDELRQLAATPTE